jgi:hypothetical protein
VPPWSNVAQFKDKDFGQSMDWDVPDALKCPFCHRSKDKSSREHQGSVLERGCNFISTGGSVRILRMTRTTVIQDSSCGILTVSVLQGSQAVPQLTMSCGYGRDLNVYMHTRYPETLV